MAETIFEMAENNLSNDGDHLRDRGIFWKTSPKRLKPFPRCAKTISEMVKRREEIKREKGGEREREDRASLVRGGSEFPSFQR
jgi:hypothetical protein